ncbi:MAG: TetR/AcrR family transcriptional regulator [Leucobacter sp.]
MSAHSHRSSSVIARDEAILDAVSAGLRRYGPRKLTAQDVADAAGISRMTLYRAMGSMDNAILLALTREFGRAVATLRAALPPLGVSTGAARLAMFLGAAARSFVDSDLIASVLAQQPDLIEPYLSGRLGRSQELVLDAIEELRREGLADGSISEPAPSSLTLLLLVRGVALGAPLLTGEAFARSTSELTGLALAALGAGLPEPVDPPTSPVKIA